MSLIRFVSAALCYVIARVDEFIWTITLMKSANQAGHSVSESLALLLSNAELVPTLRLPAASTPAFPSSGRTRPSRRKRILVVDGDRDTRQLYSELLTGSGYEVETAEDGETGWQVLRAVRYNPDSHDLLITDNGMPKLSGIELIRKLRLACMTLPVILASGAPLVNTERLQLAAILPKPFSLDQLAETVKEVLLTRAGSPFSVSGQ